MHFEAGTLTKGSVRVIFPQPREGKIVSRTYFSPKEPALSEVDGFSIHLNLHFCVKFLKCKRGLKRYYKTT